MDAKKLHILRHALGLNRSERQYRNRFVTGPGSIDYPHCEALVAGGLMRRRDGSEITGGDYSYTVTDEGKAVATGEGQG